MSSLRYTSILLLALAACGGDEQCDPNAPGTICTIAGNGSAAYFGDEGPATEASLYAPQDMAISPEGELWLLDFNNYRIRAVDKAGMIRTVIGTGLLGDSPDEGVERIPALEAWFNHTPDFFFHDGYLYLAAWHNARINRVRLSDMTLERFAGMGTRVQYAGDGGPAMMANLDLPSSIALGPTNDIVVMDQANMVIRAIDLETGIIDRIAGKCVVEGPAGPCDAPVSCPADTTNADKFVCGDPAILCPLACTPSYAGDGGPALEARMAQPYGQQADPAGRLKYLADGSLVFADTDNNRIRKIDPNGIITTIAGTGEKGYAGDDGPALEAQLNHPIDIDAAPDGTIYFTDVLNSCIRKIDPAGIMRRVVGTCSPKSVDRGFEGDGGDPLAAKLDRPYGIMLDGKKLYVADSYNQRIRVVNL
jgi:hypothetical protein